ncbi:MAG: 30S ribosomal protein S9 [Candidatus Moranbacteria bacterium]|nr:30S ribosomal protein S9 [Candidatus Moranbacteria bacterium]
MSRGKYFYAIGKRKTAVAQVKIFPVAKQEKIEINHRQLNNYFPLAKLQDILKAPLSVTGQENKFNLEVKVFGGGFNAQAEAVRLGIARALIKFDEGFRKQLKGLGYLRRDDRKVERKKPGLKKARRGPQWAKR